MEKSTQTLFVYKKNCLNNFFSEKNFVILKIIIIDFMTFINIAFSFVKLLILFFNIKYLLLFFFISQYFRFFNILF